MVNELLPVGAEAPLCSDFARSIKVLPPGSGLFLARVILVSVPLPWPKPALKHAHIVDAAASVMGASVPSRLFAAEPLSSEILVEVFERSDGATSMHSWTVGDTTLIAAVVKAVVDAPLGGLQELDVRGAERKSARVTAPTFLVCTQGSHDTCCGVSGVALADEIEKERPGYVVRRVSHTGGHRFSPTLLAFPEGRMWAFADLALVDRIADGSTTVHDHHHHARGWWGAKVGPAQVAECAVRAERAGQAFVEPTIEPVPSEQGHTPTDFVVSVQQQSWTVSVRVGREVPSIACEAPGGLPAKPGREFAWTIEQV